MAGPIELVAGSIDLEAGPIQLLGTAGSGSAPFPPLLLSRLEAGGSMDLQPFQLLANAPFLLSLLRLLLPGSPGKLRLANSLNAKQTQRLKV